MEKPISKKEYEFPNGEWVCLHMDEQTWEFMWQDKGETYLTGNYYLDAVNNEVNDYDGVAILPIAVIAALAMNYDLDLELEKK